MRGPRGGVASRLQSVVSRPSFSAFPSRRPWAEARERAPSAELSGGEEDPRPGSTALPPTHLMPGAGSSRGRAWGPGGWAPRCGTGPRTCCPRRPATVARLCTSGPGPPAQPSLHPHTDPGLTPGPAPLPSPPSRLPAPTRIGGLCDPEATPRPFRVRGPLPGNSSSPAHFSRFAASSSAQEGVVVAKQHLDFVPEVRGQ